MIASTSWTYWAYDQTAIETGLYNIRNYLARAYIKLIRQGLVGKVVAGGGKQ